MTEEEIPVHRLFERVRAVEWKEEKAASNWHGIDSTKRWKFF
jgi:hypothetical protein